MHPFSEAMHPDTRIRLEQGGADRLGLHVAVLQALEILHV